ncbi:lysostaphin resistance A-like protein [Altericista sp. CCNU0014]|uniref:CPBP family intramembrane glutamic endopeptidase n=1 Tax=Altericista sp. CCNU0014 TaxID=3082949 RepID=UPI00384AA397
MKVYRPILVALAILVGLLASNQLISSWTKPQVQSQLNLYQSDLVLSASEWKVLDREVRGETSLQKSFLGENPIEDAIKSYKTVRVSAQKEVGQLDPGATKPSKPTARSTPDANELPKTNVEMESGAPIARSPQNTQGQLVDALDLRLGLLYSKAGESDKALQTWTELAARPKAQASTQKIVPTAQVLLGLWSDPPRLLPNAEAILNKNLNGWFRVQALSKLYSLQQRPDAALELETAAQNTARSAFFRLLVVGAMPVLGSIVGAAILLIWGIRTVFKREKPVEFDSPSTSAAKVAPLAEASSTETAIAARSEPILDSGTGAVKTLPGSVSWPTETIWQVMVLWFSAFFGVSYILVPTAVAVLGLKPETFDGRLQAYFSLFTYGCLMGVGFGILQLSLQPYIPNVLRWLRLKWEGNWLAWGVGGYFAALPLVLIVSLLNQKLLKEQGGGNPILEIILQGRDKFTIALLWFLVAVCAPLLEETLFRGFFLTSLARYMPVWQAIALSGVVFALAHFTLGDVLPLSLLGVVLGVVYWRSRNLLASMLLHSLWNSGSFIGLLVLGSGGN